MKKILITGGAGFIGYHLARRVLNDKNVRVVIVDNLSRGRFDHYFDELVSNPQVRFIKLDLTEENSTRALGGGYDHVYHLAAVNGTKHFYQKPHEVLRINTLSLVHLLEWMRKKNIDGKFCFTSSNEAYAGGLNAFNALPIPTPEKVPLVIEDPYNPRWSYGATKLIGELFVIHYAKVYGFRALLLRPHNFYGPREGFDHVIPELSVRIASKENPFAMFGGTETRSFCYIDDAVEAMQLLMDSPKTDVQPIETVHIGSEEEVTIKDLTEKMFDIVGWQPAERIEKSSPAGSVKRRLADISKVKNLVGWTPKTPLSIGLTKTYAWYLENKDKKPVREA